MNKRRRYIAKRRRTEKRRDARFNAVMKAIFSTSISNEINRGTMIKLYLEDV